MEKPEIFEQAEFLRNRLIYIKYNISKILVPLAENGPMKYFSCYHFPFFN